MSKKYSFERVIDANLNRLKEGIRVCEDIARYLHNDKKLSASFKKLRHKAKCKNYKKLLNSRDILKDPLKRSIKDELIKSDINDLIASNSKRSQESARVLEEIFKIVSKKTSNRYKKIRYKLYSLEKKLIIK